MTNLVNNRNELGLLLNALNLHGNGIEIGVAKGNYSMVILTFGLKKLYLLDTWKEFKDEEYADRSNNAQAVQDKFFEKVVEITKGHNVEIIKGDSRIEHKRFANGFFDFVYIDANHAYEYVKQDIINWYPKVRKGGILAGHDYVNIVAKKVGVEQAVNEFCRSKGLSVQVIPKARRVQKSWYIIKQE